MRISDKMITSFVSRNSAASKATYFDAIGKATSGQKITTPSQDPAGAIRVTEYDRLLTRLGRCQKNLHNVDHGLRLADRAMVEMVDLVGETRALAIQMANGGMSQTDWNAAAVTAEGHFDQLLSLANQRLQDGRYLFGGVDEDTPPYGEGGVYQGSAVNRQVEVAQGVFVDGTTTGLESFGDGSQVFGTIAQFIDDLKAGNTAGITQAIDDLGDSVDFALVNVARVGARGQHLHEVDFTNQELQTHFQVERARFAEVDQVEAFTNVVAAETGLNTVVELSSRLLQTSLLSFLR